MVMLVFKWIYEPSRIVVTVKGLRVVNRMSCHVVMSVVSLDRYSNGFHGSDSHRAAISSYSTIINYHNHLRFVIIVFYLLSRAGCARRRSRRRLATTTYAVQTLTATTTSSAPFIFRVSFFLFHFSHTSFKLLVCLPCLSP
jgi:hypothetical protein